MQDILQRDGLTVDMLTRLSYESELGISLKKNLHYFERDKLLEEIIKINGWYDSFAELHELALDCVKCMNVLKYYQSKILRRC